MPYTELPPRMELFDSDQFIFEFKVDGFRALAHIEAGKGELISRNGNVFRGFADLATWIAEHLRVEIACVDDVGRCFVICCSAGGSACSPRLTCCTSMAKTSAHCLLY